MRPKNPYLMTREDFIALLKRMGYAYTATDAGVEIIEPGPVYLPNLTSLPENTTFSNGGYVYLDSLTALPENTTFRNGSGVYLPSLASEYQTYRGQTIRLRYIDGDTMLIRSERQLGGATVYSAAYFGGGDLDNLQSCYIAQIGDTYAHGDSIETALRDCRFKQAERDFDPDQLAAEIRQRGTVTFNDFRLITGACESGLRHGMKQAGLPADADELPLETVLAAAFGSFGETFKRLFEGARA